MSTNLFEIRDYYYSGDFDLYKQWWEESIGVLRKHLDIVGLWFDSGIPENRWLGRDGAPPWIGKRDMDHSLERPAAPRSGLECVRS